jgi:ribosomal protein S18 acetylase RimI-like enzyme
MIQTEPTIAIRLSTEADFDALQDLIQEMDRHQARLAGGLRSAGQVRSRRLLQEWLRDKQGLLLICERKGDIVGCLRASLERALAVKPGAQPPPYLKVHELVVARRARNSGIGSALMSEAEAWARRKRARSVRMDVLARNHEAVSFCDELGFETLSASLEKRI